MDERQDRRPLVEALEWIAGHSIAVQSLDAALDYRRLVERARAALAVQSEGGDANCNREPLTPNPPAISSSEPPLPLGGGAERRAREAAEAELKSLRAFKRSVDEALNSGDGTYKP